MKIGEFDERMGTNARQVRFLIHEGFVPSPGTTSAASYGVMQEEALARYQSKRAAGMTPVQIKAEMKDVMPLSVVMSPGVKLVLDPGVPGWVEPDADEFVRWAREQLKAWQIARAEKERAQICHSTA